MLEVILIIACLISGMDEDKKALFTPPLEIPISLSANFGELRADHFHSGIDFKTSGVTGLRVNSVAEGYVYRISVSPSGFGKAVYIRHSTGYSTVYGHLEGFSPGIENYVEEEQYRRKRFAVELFPDETLFRVERGQLIGYSGNSGSSSGPHLHFEIRKSANEKPVDPLQFYSIEDGIKPRIDLLAAYQPQKAYAAGDEYDRDIYKVVIENGEYYIENNRPVRVSGPVGFGISSFDFLDNSWNKVGVRSIDVYADSTLIYSHILDEFAFAETRYINSLIDYEYLLRSGKYIQKAFVEPNNKLGIYRDMTNQGYLEVTDSLLHKMKIIVSDFNGNKAILNFGVVRGASTPPEHERAREESVRMSWSSENVFRSDGVSIFFPRDCFYRDLPFRFSAADTVKGLLSPTYNIHDRYTPVHNAFELALTADRSLEKFKDKLALVMVDGDMVSYAGGDWDSGKVRGKVRSLGSYAIGIDTIPPSVSPVNFSDGQNLSGRKVISFKIDDNLSGVKEYYPELDGSWVLFEWDPKNRSISMRPDGKRIKKGALHQLKLEVTDNRNNTTTREITFTW